MNLRKSVLITRPLLEFTYLVQFVSALLLTACLRFSIICSPHFLLILVHGYIHIESCSCPSNYVAVAVCSVQMQLLT